MSSETDVEPSPAERVSTPIDGVHVLGSLSPSRAGDYITCPLLYRFRTVDRLPEPSSPDAVRGSVVHKVLEDLFDLAPAERTPDRAAAMIDSAWDAVLEREPAVGLLFESGEGDGNGEGGEGGAASRGGEVLDRARWLASCRTALEAYFTLEDPTRLEPAEREVYVEAVLDSKLLLRGFIDRLDVAADGSIRVVDYKTGRSPGEGFETKALFQLRFYALVLWRTRGVVPAMLQLVYLGNGELLRYVPDEHDLLATEQKVHAIWQAIRLAQETGDWRPRRSRACSWCAHQQHCPEFGGTPPPLPVAAPLPTSRDGAGAPPQPAGLSTESVRG